MTPHARSARVRPAAIAAGALALLLVALTASLFSTRGTGDIGIWERWTGNALRAGVVQGFRENDNDYPPLSNVVLWITGHAASAAGVPLPAAIKLSLLIFLAVTLVIFYAWCGRPALTLALWAVTVLNAVGMGYLDMYAMPPLLVSVWALQRGRHVAAVTWFSVACLVKWQPLIIAPFLLLHAGLAGGPPGFGRWRAYLRLVLPALVLVALTALVFQPAPVLRAFAKGLGHRILSGDTLNLGWIVTWMLEWNARAGPGGATALVTAIPDGPLVWRLLLKIAFAGPFLVLLVRFVRGPMRFERTLAYSFVGFLGYITLSSGVHENHWFVPAVLAVALAGFRREWLAPAAAVGGVANLNLLLFYGWSGRGPEMSRVVGMDLSVPLAAAVVLMYVWIWRRLSETDRTGWDAAPAA